MKAVIFGPGRIGCGFAGHLLHASGYELTFVGRGASIDQLSRAGRYRVRLGDGRRAGHERVEVVEVARAVHTGDAEAVARTVAEADLVAVSVGPANLVAIAPLLASGLARRSVPVNVIAFENCAEPGACLREAVIRAVPAVAALGHGFSGGLVSRIVTRRIDDQASEPPVFVGDCASDFVVEARSLCAPVPRITGMRLVDDYAAWTMKKLYTFSAGHAAAAYLGALKGYRYIHSAIRDPEIRAAVLAAMEEGRRGLARRYGPEVAGTHDDLLAIIARFENAALDDPVSRVGRDPLRKLGPQDRLLGAARLAAEAGVPPRRLALVAAAALCFVCSQDASTYAAPAAVATAVAGLDPGGGVGREVLEAFHRLAEHREPDNVLLSLRDLTWSWSRDSLAPAAASVRKIA